MLSELSYKYLGHNSQDDLRVGSDVVSEDRFLGLHWA